MENKKQFFSMIEPSENLKNSIINTIKREKTKKTIYKIAFSSILSLVSVSMVVIFVTSIIKDAYQSGLSEYLSLLVSDGALVASYWKAYVMSIIESLPILQITVVFASTWVFLWSISSVSELIKDVKLVKKLKSANL